MTLEEYLDKKLKGSSLSYEINAEYVIIHYNARTGKRDLKRITCKDLLDLLDFLDLLQGRVLKLEKL